MGPGAHIYLSLDLWAPYLFILARWGSYLSILRPLGPNYLFSYWPCGFPIGPLWARAHLARALLGRALLGRAHLGPFGSILGPFYLKWVPILFKMGHPCKPLWALRALRAPKGPCGVP